MSDNETPIERINDELARMLFGNSLLSIIGNAGIAIVVAVFLANQVSQMTLGLWLGVTIALTIIRLAFVLQERRSANPISIRGWRTQHTISAGISGLLWGVAMILFFTPSLFHQVLLTLAVAGLTAGAAASYGAWPRAFFAFAIPSLVPLAYKFFGDMTETSTGLGIMISLYVAVITSVALGVHKSLRRIVVLGIERESLVENLSLAKESAELMSRAKDDLLARVSHELRTPMNAILGFAQLLHGRQASTEDPEAGREAKQILDAGRHLISLIEEILELTNVATGDIPLTLAPVSSARCIGDCVSFSGAVADARDIRIVDESTDQNLPYVIADDTRFREILLNLLSNAIKYSPRGSRVTVTAEESNDGVLRISIADEGRGIPADAYELIFEPFGRVEGSAEHVEGTGIGLAVCKRLVELMNGNIGVASVEGRGSTFWIELPIDETVDAEQDSNRNQNNDVSFATPPKGIKILYIEDDEDNRGVMDAIFEHLAPDSILRCAATAEQGVALMSDEMFDAVLMDINLPGMDGFAAFDQIRSDYETAGIPIIAISAAARPEDRERALQRGFNEYLTKPIEVDSLFQSINVAVDGRKQRDG